MDSSSGLSPPLFSFLFKACQVPQPQIKKGGKHRHEGTKKRVIGQDDEGTVTEGRKGRGERKMRVRLWVQPTVLTHSLCLLIIRSMSSFIFLYLSSDSGLWPTESSASGSGLSQPFRPFFLNVCKQRCTILLRVGHNNPAQSPGRDKLKSKNFIIPFGATKFTGKLTWIQDYGNQKSYKFN